MELEFEWDEDKAKSNLSEHGVSFLIAAAIFADEIMERSDNREDYGEVRLITSAGFRHRSTASCLRGELKT